MKRNLSMISAVFGQGNALLRRWYVVAAVLLFMMPVIVQAQQAVGVYWTKVDLMFLPPPGASALNPLRADDGVTIPYAALVERSFNSLDHPPAIHTSGAPLYGTGIRSGYAVYLPNTGTQWESSFSRPAITLEVVQESPEEVLTVLAGLQQNLDRLAVTPQERMGVTPKARITTQLAPESPRVMYIDARNTRAVVALLVLTLSLAVATATMVDRLVLKRQREQRGRGGMGGGKPGLAGSPLWWTFANLALFFKSRRG
ncbi:hypothetical protein [Crystallibacter degradans]|uniref:hypothetical protein n=1 Tax=Crystallibacter degradans TaxID=2726743 RepID=UPI0014741EC4|nr:hypothetical protein [Arthrobacter sp. SF27]NMR28209.1 hypothetical protein [Arthrobacter sp. SF27]